ncbi:MAG: efflux RND transporter periplasmic adaptor subunit [Pseudomonadota bacterium]
MNARFKVLLLNLCGFFTAFSTYVHAQQPISVIAEKAVLSTIGDTIEALGTLQANELVEITALATERVEEIGFDDGVRVKKGQMLVAFASGEERARLSEIKAARREADAELARSKTLASRDAASETELSERRRAAEVAAAQERAINAQIADRVIRAPFDGIVGIRSISVGAIVSPGDIITRLVDDSIMKLDFSIPAPYLSEVSVGTPIEAKTRAYGAKVFRGEITSIDSVVDPITRTLLVRAIIPNDARRLRAGLLMEANLLVNQRDAIIIDERALIPDGEKTFVYVANSSEQDEIIAEKREVKVGRRYFDKVEILSGLKETEDVIVEGSTKLRPGTKIMLDGSIKRAANQTKSRTN